MYYDPPEPEQQNKRILMPKTAIEFQNEFLLDGL
jgi:hypothetical protein